MFIKPTLIYFCLFFALTIFAQTELIIPIQPDPNANIEATDFLFAQPTTIWMHYIDLRLSDLSNANTFNLSFHNEDYNINFDRMEVRGTNNYSWFGKNTDGDGSIIISVLGNDVQGILTKGSEIYRILTTAKGVKAIIHIDQSQYPQEACYNNGALAPNVQKSTNGQSQKKETNHIKQALANGCTIKGLVMYTPAAEAAMKGSGDPLLNDIKNAIQIAVNRTNEAFIRSEITDYDPIELVLVNRLNFEETDDAVLDLVRLKDSTAVHILRDQYNADFCMLITDYVYGYCGYAYVGASNTSAYGLVPYSCMIENLSFAHEFGHLFGADHNVDSEPITISGDGHGYIYHPGRWRTIMSSYTPCLLNGYYCERKAFYSNPYVENIATFQQPENTFSLSNTTYANNNSLYANILAKQNITSTGIVTVQDNATLILKAGERIRLNGGFSTKSNVDVDIYIETIEDCQ